MSDNTPTLCRDCSELTSGKCWRHSGYPVTEGLVTKVRTAAGTYQPSWVMPVCMECGALIVDAKLHDDFHERVEGPRDE